MTDDSLRSMQNELTKSFLDLVALGPNGMNEEQQVRFVELGTALGMFGEGFTDNFLEGMRLMTAHVDGKVERRRKLES